MSERTYVIGLLGEGIGGSLAKPLQEREGAANGISLAYRLVDSSLTGLTVADTRDVLTWAVRLGFDGLNVTHPFKNAAVQEVDEATPEALALGAVNTLLIRDGRTIGHNTDWVGFASSLQAALPEATADRMVLLGAGGGGVAVGYGALRAGAAHLDVVDRDPARAEQVVARLRMHVGDDRVSVAEDLEAALADAGGLIQATPVGMNGHPGMPISPRLLRPDLWVADIVYFPLETELIRSARDIGCRVMTGGGMAVYQHATAFELFTGEPADIARMGRHFAELTGQNVALADVS